MFKGKPIEQLDIHSDHIVKSWSNSPAQNLILEQLA